MNAISKPGSARTDFSSTGADAPAQLGRRALFTAAAAGGLLVGFGVPPSTAATAKAAALPVTQNPVTAWVVIGSDETITLFCPGSEMGQGVISGMPQVIAEELGVDWTKVSTQMPPVAAVYDNPVTHSRFTGGSYNMRGWFPSLLQIGATAREMLISAAAVQLNEPRANLQAKLGKVVSIATGKSATFGSLAAAAATLTPPANPPILSATKGYTLVGTAVPRPDLPSKVDGSAIYGIDVRVPGMVYAGVQHAPVFGGMVASAPAGAINLGNAVAFVANDTWTAIQGARNLKVGWTDTSAAANNVDSQNIAQLASRLMSGGTPATAETIGNPAAAIAAAPIKLDMTYSLPYVAHACMEVLNCTVSVTSSSCTVWAPTQSPDAVAALAAKLTGLPPSKIVVNSVLMGGGLGRKGETDYVAQAIKVAMAIGKPVKLVWSREEDFTNDFYRPTALSRLQVGVDPKTGAILGWMNRLVSPSILASHFPGAIKNGVDGQAVDGAIGSPYAMGSRLVEYIQLPSTIPVGFWRSVGNSINAFVIESAIDEIAFALKQDPLAYRQQLLAGNARMLNVLNTAAKMAGWGTPVATGHARGIAVHFSFGTYVAEVVEIAKTATGGIQLVRVSCAVDCGIAVNPDSVIAQMQGGINHGLGAAMSGQMTWQQGIADQQNFDNYRMLRMRDAPRIDVQIVNTAGAPLGGIGEPGVPPAAPALANAYFALTGTRVRALPMMGGGGGN